MGAEWLCLGGATVVALGLAGILLRVCLRDLWDGIGAVAIFFVLFAVAGGLLGETAEHAMRQCSVLDAQTPRAAVVAAAGLVAASVTATFAAACIAVLRAFASLSGRERA